MPSSSVGSDVFALLCLANVGVYVTLLLRYYLPLRTTPGYILLPVFLALALPFSIILLVPIDLASDGSRDHAIWLPEALTLVCWKISYWLTFVLTWLLLPLLGEYVDSGFRSPKDRFIYSLRSNARYQLIAFGIAAIGLVYYVMQNGLHGQSIKSLIMALAYAWGLVLAMYLMGHGLVVIPRNILQSASLGRRLRTYQSQAPRLHEKIEQAFDDLTVLEVQLLQLQRRKNDATSDIRDWIDELSDTAPTVAGRARAQQQLLTATPQVPPIATPRYLAEFSRKLKRARHKHARFTGEWQNLVARVTYLQQVIDASPSKRLVFSTALDDKTLFTMPLLTPRVRFHLHAHVLPACRFALGILLALLSVALVWSEVAHTLTSRISIINWAVVSRPASSSAYVTHSGQFIASIWLLYMCTAALCSLSKLKVWGNRALVKRQTYAESAAWYSLQVAKLTVPLSYNFITMLDPAVYQSTSFFAFFGKSINLTPLGKGFSAFFPIFVLVPVSATLFNFYGRIRRVLGFLALEDEDEIGGSHSGMSTPSGSTASWQEGALLIQRDQQSAVRPPHARRQQRQSTALPAYTDHPSPLGVDQPRTQYRDHPAAGQQGSRRNEQQAENDSDDSARYFFHDLGERVRNTIDTADRPEWLRDVGSLFKKPAWMSGENRAGSSNGGSSTGRILGSGSGGNGRSGAIRL